MPKPLKILVPVNYIVLKNFSKRDPTEIFDEYWSTRSTDRQRDFIFPMVEENVPVTQRQQESKKARHVVLNNNLQYKEEKHPVCKQHFLATLDIGQRLVESALKYKSACGFPFQKRITRESANKVPIARIAKIRQHFEPF